MNAVWTKHDGQYRPKRIEPQRSTAVAEAIRGNAAMAARTSTGPAVATGERCGQRTRRERGKEKKWMATCAAALLVAGWSVGVGASTGLAQLPGQSLERAAKWQQPAAAEVHLRLLDWMSGFRTDPSIERQVAELWPEDLTQREADDLLRRVALSIARVDPRAAELVRVCSGPRVDVRLPDVEWLAGDDVAAFERNQLRLFYARWLVHEQLYDEALEQLAELRPDDVIDPATLLFCQSVVYHRLLHKEEALRAMDALLHDVAGVPRRYRAVVELMQKDLADLKEDSLDHIARRMDDIRRRLDLGHAGPKVRSVEDGVIESLDKLIEELEKQQQQQQQQASAGSSMPSGRPADESRILGGSGRGDVGSKKLGRAAAWGDLPPKQREAALQSIGRQFPAHYRDVIEQYFRKLADESNSEPGGRATPRRAGGTR